MVQMAMGNDGNDRRASAPTGPSGLFDRDFVFIMSSYLIDPGYLSPEGQ